MKFVNTELTYLFTIVAGLVVLFIFARRKRKGFFENFAQEHLLPKIAFSWDRRRQNVKTILVLAAVILSVIAVLRPQWGFVWEEVRHRGIDFFIAVDVSQSMLTKDVLPSRLERTKLALEDLTKRLSGDRVGLIAFAGSAFVQCPLTIDYSGFLLAVSDLNVYTIPRSGTNIASAIREALQSFAAGSQGINRALVIVTDGENHEGDVLAAAKQAAAEGVKIYTIGVGTTQGELISIPAEDGTSSFLKDSEGRVVKSRLNEKLLQEIALASGGAYVKATPTQFGLDSLYNNKIAAMEKKERESTMEKRLLDRFQIPLACAVVLLFIEPFIGTRRKK